MYQITIGKRPFAIGLWWQIENSSSQKVLRRKAQELLKQFASDYNCVCYCNRQIGFGKYQTAKLVRMESLAAHLQRDLPSFVGIFKIDDGPISIDTETPPGKWWVFATKNGTILADGDSIFDSEEDALRHKDSLVSLNGEFDSSEIHESVKGSFSRLEPLIKRHGFFDKKNNLIPIVLKDKTKRRFATKLFLVGGVALLSYGMVKFQDHRKEQEAIQKYRFELAQKEIIRKQITSSVDSYFAKSWAKEPLPQDKIGYCFEKMIQVPISSSGWKLSGVTCEDSYVVVSWKHQYGGSYLMPPDNSFDIGPNSARSKTSIAFPNNRNPNEDIGTKNTFLRQMFQVTQDSSARFTVSWSAVEKKIVQNVEIVCPWVSGSWELSGVPAAALADGSLLSQLDKAGVVVSSVSVTESGEWKIRGVAYVTP